MLYLKRFVPSTGGNKDKDILSRSYSRDNPSLGNLAATLFILLGANRAYVAGGTAVN